jgi:hypothetical protein
MGYKYKTFFFSQLLSYQTYLTIMKRKLKHNVGWSHSEILHIHHPLANWLRNPCSHESSRGYKYKTFFFSLTIQIGYQSKVESFAGLVECNINANSKPSKFSRANQNRDDSWLQGFLSQLANGWWVWRISECDQLDNPETNANVRSIIDSSPGRIKLKILR